MELVFESDISGMGPVAELKELTPGKSVNELGKGPVIEPGPEAEAGSEEGGSMSTRRQTPSDCSFIFIF